MIQIALRYVLLAAMAVPTTSTSIGLPEVSARDRATLIFGVRLVALVYVGLGVIGFLPVDTLNPIHSDGVVARYLLNLIAVDPVHNTVHLLIGLSGLWAATSARLAHTWSLVFGATLLFLFFMGMLQAALLGFPPIQVLVFVTLNSPGHVLHLVTGGLLVQLGLLRSSE